MAAIARDLEREVFANAFGDTAELLAAEYGPYETSSVYLIVLDRRQRIPAGMMRVILPLDAGLKSINDVEALWDVRCSDVYERSGIPFHPHQTWDVATLAVAPEYRGNVGLGTVSAALYQALSMIGKQCGFRYHVAVMDVAVHRMTRWRLNRPFQALAELDARSYMGSQQSVPVWGDTVSWHQRLARLRPDLYRMMCLGQGLEAHVYPSDWDTMGQIVLSMLGARPNVVPLLG